MRLACPPELTFSLALAVVAAMLFVPGLPGCAGADPPDPNGSWLEFSPPFRQGHCGVYDPEHDRMIVIGGASTTPAMSSVWGYSLSSGSWSRLIDSGGPGPRVYASAVLDSAHNRIILFGGQGNSTSGGMFNDVWQLTLSATPSWTQLTPGGPSPPARAWAAAIFDPVNNRMIIIGGYDGLSDVWQLSLSGNPAWTEITPAGGPGPRMAASALYDPVRRRAVLFGGRDPASPSDYQNDVWSLSLSGPPVWTRNFALGTPPAPRAGSSAIYDPNTDSMILFGGGSTYNSYNEVWQLPLSGSPAWSLLSTSGTPPTGRTFQSAIRDDGRNRMVVYGGGNQGQGDQGTFALSLDAYAWSALSPAAASPSARTGHSVIYDPIQDRLILFGGSVSTGTLWQCPLAGTPVWSPMVPSGSPPSPRQNHAAVWDPVRNRMLVFGGSGVGFPQAGPYNDFWSLRLDGVPTWQQFGTTSAPVARQGHTMIYDPVVDRLLMFGGAASNTANTNVKNDVWALGLGGGPPYGWVQLAPTGIPPLPRTKAGGIYDPARNRFVIYGGTDGTSVFDDAWALSLTDPPAWELLMPSGSPAQQSDQPAVYDPVRDRLVSLGKSGDVWDVRALSFAAAENWDMLSPTGDPGYSTAGGAGIYDPLRDRVVIFGASGSSNPSTWALTWGEGLSAWVHGSGDRPWIAGTVNTLQYRAYNPFGFSMLLDCQLTCDRNWPGLPISSAITVPANDSLSFGLGVPVPDTAAGGAATLQLRAVFRSLPYASNPASRLVDPAAVLAVDLPTSSSPRVRVADRNPSRGPLRVTFGLAPGSPARLDLLDAQGRRWRSVALDPKSSLEGTVDLTAGESVPAGVYFVRLLQGRHSALTRAVILR